MALTKEELRLMLDNEETRYNNIAGKIGTENIKHLEEFAKGRNLMRAQKAIYLSSLMKDDAGQPVLTYATGSRNKLKKIAAASGLKNIKSERFKNMLAERLIRTEDVSVRKIVLGSIRDTDVLSDKLKKSIHDLSKKKGSKFIKDLSKTTFKNIKK